MSDSDSAVASPSNTDPSVPGSTKLSLEASASSFGSGSTHGSPDIQARTEPSTSSLLGESLNTQTSVKRKLNTSSSSNGSSPSANAIATCEKESEADLEHQINALN